MLDHKDLGYARKLKAQGRHRDGKFESKRQSRHYKLKFLVVQVKREEKNGKQPEGQGYDGVTVGGGGKPTEV